MIVIEIRHLFSSLYSGWALGEHQEWSKYSNFEVAVRIPLLISVPWMTHTPGTAGANFGLINPLKDEYLTWNMVGTGGRRCIGTLKSLNRDMWSKHDMVDKTQTSQMKTYRGRRKSVPGGRLHSQEEGSSVSRRGLQSAALVEAVDLFASLADLAGLTVPVTCPLDSRKLILCTEGASFAPILRKFKSRGGNVRGECNWKKAAFSQYPRPSFKPQINSDQPRLKDITIMGYSMRTCLYRYTEWIHFNSKEFSGNWTDVQARELYLHSGDPLEDRNVAQVDTYQGLVKQLSAQLKAGWRSAQPRGMSTV